MFCRLCRPAVPPENFLQPTCPQMKPASRPKLYPCAQGEPTRFFLDSKMPKETLIYTFLHSSGHLHGRPRSKIPASDSAQSLQQKSLTLQSATATLKKISGVTHLTPQETPNLDFSTSEWSMHPKQVTSTICFRLKKMASRLSLRKKRNEWRMNGDRLRKSAYFGQDFLHKFKVWHF